MVRTQELRSELRILTFDIFETILDLEGCFERVLDEYFAEKGYDIHTADFYRDYQRYLVFSQMVDAHLDTPRTSFKELCRRSLQVQLDSAGIDYSNDEVYDLLDVWWSLSYHPGIPSELHRLQEEYTIVALSSGDRDILEAGLDPANDPNVDFEFDEIISAGEANTYKPAPEPYELVLEKYDVAPNEVMHVAAHTFDIIAPKAVGLRACYIKRGDQPDGKWEYESDLSVEDIPDLTDALTPQ